MMSVAGKRMGMMKTGTVWGVICGLALWLFAGLFSCAMAANVSCNYASSGGANTQCVVASEMWLGIQHIGYGQVNDITLTDNMGYRLEMSTDYPFFYGNGLPATPYCVDGFGMLGSICSNNKWDMNTGSILLLQIVYNCSGVADCGGPLAIDVPFYYASGSVSPIGYGSFSAFSYHYQRVFSGSYGSCSETGEVDTNSSDQDRGTHNGTHRQVDFSCSINIPVGQLFLSRYPVSLAPVNSFAGQNWTMAGIRLGSIGDIFNYGYVISQPWASCDSPGVSSYVFEATGTANYTIHSRSKQDSVAVKLVPKQHISNCTHNVYSWAGADGWYHTTAKLAVKSETSSCDKNVSNAYSTIMNGSDVNINWTISGLSTLAAGTQVNCTHNLVTELTWY